MNTYIIASKDLDKATAEADRIIKQNKINKFDIEQIEPEQALGIEDIRNIQKRIFLKPFKGEKKAVIVNAAPGISDEAQNSMLKLLEEPPPNTLIFLITGNVHIFLPTVLSRVKVIEIKADENQTNPAGLKEVLSMQGVGDSLFLAQNVSKDKEKAIVWLEEVILAARDEMHKNLDDKEGSLKYRKLIHKLELTHYDLKTTNVNPRLSLENLFLNI